MLDYREKDNDKIQCPLCKNDSIIPHDDFNNELKFDGFYICPNSDCKLNQVPIFVLPIVVKN